MTANLRRVAAFHEAGHAVAAVMRGGSTLTSVSLDEQVHGAGITWSRAHVWDQAFIIWAGPWAEARHAWGDRPLDGEDEDGCTLADYVFGVFLTQPVDSADYDRATRADDELGSDGRGRGVAECVVWPAELQQVWPAVEHVAARLLEGDAVAHAEVEAAVERCWAEDA